MTGRLPAVSDVLVIGGGPAGSTVAGLLARGGWQVTLLDRARFPRPKACGECLNPGAVAALDRLGLLSTVRALNPIELIGWDIRTPDGRTSSGRFGEAVGPGLAVARDRLDRALLERARDLGVDVRTGISVDGVQPAGHSARHGTRARTGPGAPPDDALPRVAVRDLRGTSRVLAARVVVGADGLRSRTARALNLGIRSGTSGRDKLSLTVRLEGSGPPIDRGRLVIGCDGTVGLAPVGPGRWNATVVVDAAAGRRVAPDPAAFAMRAVSAAIDDWHRPPRQIGGPWGSGGFRAPRARVAGDGIVLVGDAAGYYDPLTGQGIFRALRSAEIGAATVDTGLREGRVSEDVATAYGDALREAFGPGRRLQRVVEAIVSRRIPREIAIAGLGFAPSLMDALIRVTGDARPVSSLLRPVPVLAPPSPC